MARCELCGDETKSDTEPCYSCSKGFKPESRSPDSFSMQTEPGSTSGLTAEERNRIYLEEKARFEAQQQLKIESESSIKQLKKESESKISLKEFVVGVIIVIVLLGGFIAFSDSFINAKSEFREEQSQREQKEALEALNVESWGWKNSEYGSYIVGTVKNPSGKKYSYVQVDFNLYDKAGAQIGTAMANVNNLEPYGTWKFKALALEDNAQNARLNSVNGY